MSNIFYIPAGIARLEAAMAIVIISVLILDLQVTSQTIFEKQLLSDITNNIVVSGVSFESRTEVYNQNFGEERLSHLTHFSRDRLSKWRLNEHRVEDAWFLWTLVNIIIP